MAGTSDARASAFDATAFKDAIHFAMTMGTPEKKAERVTFRWPEQDTYTEADPAGRSYDWTTAPEIVVAEREKQVLCGVQFTYRPTQSHDTDLGEFDNPHVIITLLDDEYAQVAGANEVLIGGNVYDISFVAPPSSLFSVTVYQIYAQARDEA